MPGPGRPRPAAGRGALGTGVRRSTRCARVAGRGRGAWLPGAPGRRGGVDERDERAVLPEPLEGVEDTFLGVLDVDHDVAIVEPHPSPVAAPFAAPRLGAGPAQLLLGLDDDGVDLPLVVARYDHEHVG